MFIKYYLRKKITGYFSSLWQKKKKTIKKSVKKMKSLFHKSFKGRINRTFDVSQTIRRFDRYVERLRKDITFL